MNGNITPVMEHDIKEKFMSAYTSYYAALTKLTAEGRTKAEAAEAIREVIEPIEKTCIKIFEGMDEALKETNGNLMSAIALAQHRAYEEKRKKDE